MPRKPRDDEAEREPEEDEESVEDEDFDGSETIVMSDDDDDDDEDELDISMEINVDKLMAEMARTEKDDIERKKEIRRRLEEIQEQRSLEDTYSFDLYGDD